MSYFNFNPNLIDKKELLYKIHNNPYCTWVNDYIQYDKLQSVESIRFHLNIGLEILEDFNIKLSDEDKQKIETTLKEYSKYAEARTEIISAVIFRQTTCRHKNVIDIHQAERAGCIIHKITKKDSWYCPECGMTMNNDAYRSNKRYWQKIDGIDTSQNTIY